MNHYFNQMTDIAEKAKKVGLSGPVNLSYDYEVSKWTASIEDISYQENFPNDALFRLAQEIFRRNKEKTDNESLTFKKYEDYREWAKMKKFIDSIQVSYNPTAFVEEWKDDNGKTWYVEEYNGLGKIYDIMVHSSKDACELFCWRMLHPDWVG